MRSLRQVGIGLLYALVSVVLVVGGLSLALAETKNQQVSASTQTQPLPTQVGTDTPSSLVPSFTPTVAPAPVTTQAVTCQPPAGWILVTIRSGDSLASLAAKYQTSADLLQMENCLTSTELVVGNGLYVPPYPSPSTSVSTLTNCGPFPGWVKAYVVRPGDTLFHIASLYRTTVADLEQANCKTNANIFSGERLWVPNVPVVTPALTIIPTFPTSTDVPTQPLTTTPLPYTATVLPTSTVEPDATANP